MALITKDLNTPALTFQQLAQFIVGDTGTVVAGTAKFTGDNRAAGTFGGGISDGINVEAGVMFSTGKIGDTAGFMSTDLGKLGDAVLTQLLVDTKSTVTNTNDAAVLEFEFLPKQGQFSLRSEERRVGKEC